MERDKNSRGLRVAALCALLVVVGCGSGEKKDADAPPRGGDAVEPATPATDAKNAKPAKGVLGIASVSIEPGTFGMWHGTQMKGLLIRLDGANARLEIAGGYQGLPRAWQSQPFALEVRYLKAAPALTANETERVQLDRAFDAAVARYGVLPAGDPKRLPSAIPADYVKLRSEDKPKPANDAHCTTATEQSAFHAAIYDIIGLPSSGSPVARGAVLIGTAGQEVYAVSDATVLPLPAAGDEGFELRPRATQTFTAHSCTSGTNNHYTHVIDNLKGTNTAWTGKFVVRRYVP